MPTEDELTDREMLIAQEAARIAVREITDKFYRDVGKGVVHKFLIILGALFVGFGAAKGWWTFK